ncbi:MAG: DNA primase [Christensenellaceae bacterium]|nr:DNA primase [Christensenellaceae bacterium]
MDKGYPAAFMEQLKSKNDVVSVISKYVSLDKKGKTYWACCPFHYEKAPSFAVNETEQYYHCFGCGESGDVIKFVQKMDSLSFVEAVEKLAHNVGLEVPSFKGDNSQIKLAKDKEKLYHACNLAMEHYKNNLKLPTAHLAQEYIKNRGISPDTCEKFSLGFSNGWTSIIDFMKQKGIDMDTMKNAGLIEIKEGSKAYDVMANRLMFPIINAYGDCIGFTARVLEKDSQYAKYRNSAQTLIFDKSRAIYNIYNIKKIKKERNIDEVMICEGTTDVIAMVKNGFENTVACLGTATTQYHAKEIKRFVPRVILCLDGDEAGQKATFRAIDIFMEEGLEVKAVMLPENLDPDEFIKKYGCEEMAKLINKACDGIEYKIRRIAVLNNISDNLGKTKFLKEAKPIIDGIEGAGAKEIYIKLLSSLTGIATDVLRRDFDRVGVEVKPETSEAAESFREQGDQKAVKYVLASFLHKKDYANLDREYKINFSNPVFQKLYDYILDCIKDNKSYTISSIFDLFDVDENDDIKSLIDYNFEEVANPELYFKQSLNKMYRNSLQEHIDSLTIKFKQEKDIEERRKIAAELSLITKELKNIKIV